MHKALQGAVYVAVAAIAWGMGGVVASVLYRTSGIGPLAVSFWRAAFGIAVLAIVQSARRKSVRQNHKVIVVIGIGLAVYQSAYYLSIAQAGVAVGTVATLGACPVMVALGGRLFLRERLAARTVLAIGIAVAGLALLVSGGAVGPHPVAGLLWALGSAAGYATVTLVAREYAYHIGQDDIATTLKTFAVAAVCLLPFAVAEGIFPTAHAEMAFVWLLFLGIVPTAVAYTLFFVGLRTVTASVAAILVLLEPVSALAMAVGLLGERLTLSAILGTALLLAAVVTTIRGSQMRRIQRPAPHPG
ncbi:membrane protein [Rhizocola hellebori]|uniref:Membrane protein n=1 Tax=Rhizocola hellebori TaxID=1392758 RepID=A0A8J3Q307_9ACTN|nr:DMT family transporter [Rhizocola hellebori]GIH02789.1 membrane protein [Rhizocola hellebori]